MIAEKLLENPDWSVFTELAGLDERDRRRILRFHQEAGFTSTVDEREMDLRRRLDEALDALMLLEFCVQIQDQDAREVKRIPGLQELLSGSPPPPAAAAPVPAAPAASPATPPPRREPSSAFAHFLRTYLYFGARFAAGRLLAKGEAPHVAASDSELNEVPVALPSPPAQMIPDPAKEDVLRLLLASRRAQAESPVSEALDFLDGFSDVREREEKPGLLAPGILTAADTCVTGIWEQDRYALWLRGLGGAVADEQSFRTLTRGLLNFASGKAAFYTALDAALAPSSAKSYPGPCRPWCPISPVTARAAVVDLYWLAQLLRADVTAAGIVSYKEETWLDRLEHRAAESAGVSAPSELARLRQELGDIQKRLRAVFDAACDLVQNGAQIVHDWTCRTANPNDFGAWPEGTADWRTTFDEELDEIDRQRRERLFRHQTAPPPIAPAAPGQARATAFDWGGGPGNSGWSRRSQTGRHVPDLIGLAFSGGGIRSATFNLGVLQCLKDLDRLREIDYLSTVSGGGYIGAWLVANVQRTRDWLTRMTDWSPSIEHLRRFSNYLTPRKGLMSADTWTMGGTWFRNTLLVQVTVALWLAVLLVATRLVENAFAAPLLASLVAHPGNLILGLPLLLPTVCALLDLRQQKGTLRETLVLGLGVVPGWVGAFLTAGMLWAGRPLVGESFATLLQARWEQWLGPLLLLFAAFLVVATLSIEPKWGHVRRFLLGALAALLSTALAYVGLCGIVWVMLRWAWSGNLAAATWWAFVAGPPAVAAVIAVAVGLMIGVLGEASPDWRREWWTRFGSWLGICGVGFLGLSLTTVFGPLLTLWVLHRASGPFHWTNVLSILGWIATVVGGLLAGNSPRTDGDEEQEGSLSSRALGGFARLAAVAFIVGAAFLVSTGVHALLSRIWSDHSLDPTHYWSALEAVGWQQLGWSLIGLSLLGLLSSWRFDINVFSLNEFYRNRLVRCYLGATRWRPGMRRPNGFTGFDEGDDLRLSSLSDDPAAPVPYRGPFPIVNCALNLGGSSDLLMHTRHSASFVLTPLRAGADRRQVGYAPTRTFAGGVDLGQAIAVSGAAANPNMGYSTSPLVAFLLTMFNVRLGRWFPNPGRKQWRVASLNFSLVHMIKELFALADERATFVNISDGGHFENLGVYELVRRRCKVIIAADAECDPELSFASLGALVRMCKTDFGAHIDIDVESIRRQKETRLSRAHCAVGRIGYANGSIGYLIYLKSSLTGDEDVSVQQYKASQSDFPHETTADQFFAEDQFESYRRLGQHVTRLAFRGVEGEASLVGMAERLADLWVPASVGSSLFVEQAAAMERIWERLRQSNSLFPLLHELTYGEPAPTRPPGGPSEGELCLCQELLQLMENAFLTLRLDDLWDHPDNRGWKTLFTTWARSPIFRSVWNIAGKTYGSRFCHFCSHRLGLSD